MKIGVNVRRGFPCRGPPERTIHQLRKSDMDRE